MLLPLLPVTLMAVEEPLLAALLPIAASFSMYPLLKRDGLGLAYAALLAFWAAAVVPAALQVRKVSCLSSQQQPIDLVFRPHRK